MKRHAIVVAGIMVIVASACGESRGAARVDTSAANAMADSVRPAAAVLDTTAPRTMKGAESRAMFMDGDERSELQFTSRGGGALEVLEQASFGEDGKALRSYTFDAAGTMTSMTEERSQTVLSGNTSPVLQHTMLSITVEAGSSNATKLVDGKPAPVRAFEVEKARRHAEAIRKLAPK